MLVHKRVAHVQLLARRLRRVAVEQNALHLAAPQRDRHDRKHDKVLLLRRVRAEDVPSRLSRLEAAQNRLLCRRVPVALSLLERSLSWQVRRRRTTTDVATASSLPGGWLARSGMPATVTETASHVSHTNGSHIAVRQTQSILRALHLFERHRRVAYNAEMSRLQGRLRTVTQRSGGPHTATTTATDDRDAASDAQVAVRQLQLHANSLIGRPYLSARLWRLLLREPVWTDAVQLQRLQAATQSQPSSPASVAAASPSLGPLLPMCLAFSRVTLGVLYDSVVHGVQINRVSPRFAVSVPSAAWEAARRRCTPAGRATSAAGTLHDAGHNAASAERLFDLLDDVSHADTEHVAMIAAPALSRPTYAVAGKGNTTAAVAAPRTLRWLPPVVEDVMPLVVDTLALHSFLIAELPARALVQAGAAGDLLSLLVTLQKTATVTLALQRSAAPRPRRVAAEATVSVVAEDEQAGTALHTVLRRLEQALLATGCAVKDALAEQLASGEGDEAATTLVRPTTPTVAARLILDLDALHLLHPDERRSRDLLDALLLLLFPEMRTGTAAALVQRSRQSSLLAYMTRGHRRKLRQRFGGDAARTTSYLMNTVVQQARLQQRMMAAALRERFVTERHTTAVSELGCVLPLHDLVSLFQIFVSTASSGAAGWQALRTSRRVTAALFVAEAMLLSGLLRPEQATRPSRQDTTAALDAAMCAALPDVVPSLGLDSLARLWPSLAVLWSVVDARRAALPSSDKTEVVLLRALTELVLHGINAALAERLRGAADAALAGRAARAVATEASLQDLMAIAAGVQEWFGAMPPVRVTDRGNNTATQVRCGRPHDVVDQVRCTARLLRELLLHDRTLWRQVRACSLDTRLRLMQQLNECLQTAGALDQTTHSALHRIFSTV